MSRAQDAQERPDGSDASGFMVYTAAALFCLVMVAVLRNEWQSTWVSEGGRARRPVNVEDLAEEQKTFATEFTEKSRDF